MAIKGTAASGDQTYVDEPYISIRWRSVPQILFAEWKGFATSAEFRAALTQGLHAIRERHVIAYVSDARKTKVILPEDEVWARNVWLPEAVSAGLKRMAMVTAPTGLSKAIIEKVTHEFDNHGLRMRNFESVEAATTWALTGLTER